jgi:hypothetical protein
MLRSTMYCMNVNVNALRFEVWFNLNYKVSLVL